MNTKSIVIITCIVLGVAALIYFKPKSENGGTAQQGGKGGGDKPVVVGIYVVKPSRIDNTLFVTGNIMANEQAELRSEINGRVVKLYFKEGGHVKKGDKLVKIYDEDLQAQLKKLNYQLDLTSQNESRQKRLLDVKGISQEEYDRAMNDVNSVKADIDLVKAQISKTEIIAPFDGVIGLRNVSEGSYLSSSTTIASIVQLNPVKVEFSIPERYADQLSGNNQIEFSTDASDKVYSATVYASEPRIEEMAGTLKIRATCANPGDKLLPGTFVSVNLKLKEFDNALMIPTQAVIPQLKGNKLYLCKDGKALSQNVKLGLRNDSTIQVLEGINAGDTIIVTGILAVRPGSTLKILK